MLNYDLIVIGFGKAGKTLAAKMNAAGKKVAVIERIFSNKPWSARDGLAARAAISLVRSINVVQSLRLASCFRKRALVVLLLRLRY